MSPAWYVIRLKSNRESKATAYLESQQVEVFAPRYRMVGPDGTSLRTRPLFPGYLFVRLALPGPGKIKVQRCPGFVAFVTLASQPAVVDDRVINNLIRLTGADNDQLQPHPAIVPGAMVEVVSGPFRGLVGRLSIEGSGTRLVVEVTLLGRGASIPIKTDQVMPHSGAAL